MKEFQLAFMNNLVSISRIETVPRLHFFTKRILSWSMALIVLFTFMVGSTVLTANADYAFYKKWGEDGSGNGQFSIPAGTVVDSTGRVYVSDGWNNNIQKFVLANHCPGGSIEVAPGVCLVKKWGESGSANGKFNFSSGITADNSGRIYVADNRNHRIQMFHGVGTFIRAWGTPGSGNGQFNGPWDVAVDSRDVYVSDSLNKRIQKFQLANPCPAGTTQIAAGVCFVTKWGTPGTGNGQFMLPVSIAVDSQRNLYVGDVGVGLERVQKFQLANPCPAGTTQVAAGVCFVLSWGTYGTGNGQFSGLFGIAVDSQGNVYTTERGNIRVQKFQLANPCPDGTSQIVSGVCFVTTWGSFCYLPTGLGCIDPDGTGPLSNGDGQFASPWGVDVDSSGKVYVTDVLNARVEVFYEDTGVGGTLDRGNQSSTPVNQTGG
jgi:hypothetical protein